MYCGCMELDQRMGTVSYPRQDYLINSMGPLMVFYFFALKN